MQNNKLPVYSIQHFNHVGKDDFYVNTFKSHIKQHQFIAVPHKHDFYLTVVFTKGTGTHVIDFNTYAIRKGAVFTLHPGQAHQWTLSADIEGYIIFHSKSFFDLNFALEKISNYTFFSSETNSLLIIKNEKDLKTIASCYSSIVQEFKDNRPMKFQKIWSLLNILYIELSRLHNTNIISKNENSNYIAKLITLQTLIDDNYKTIKFPSQYAAIMNMSEKHLNRICKACLNKTTTDVITDRIMLEAKRQLAFGKLSVKQIANELGYENYSYFTRLFKKKTQKTPLQFADEIRTSKK